ncbi:MAG: hypothetical protein V8R14_09295 [Clostridia bacterium]
MPSANACIYGDAKGSRERAAGEAAWVRAFGSGVAMSVRDASVHV